MIPSWKAIAEFAAFHKEDDLLKLAVRRLQRCGEANYKPQSTTHFDFEQILSVANSFHYGLEADIVFEGKRYRDPLSFLENRIETFCSKNMSKENLFLAKKSCVIQRILRAFSRSFCNGKVPQSVKDFKMPTGTAAFNFEEHRNKIEKIISDADFSAYLNTEEGHRASIHLRMVKQNFIDMFEPCVNAGDVFAVLLSLFQMFTIEQFRCEFKRFVEFLKEQVNVGLSCQMIYGKTPIPAGPVSNNIAAAPVTAARVTAARVTAAPIAKHVQHYLSEERERERVELARKRRTAAFFGTAEVKESEREREPALPTKRAKIESDYDELIRAEIALERVRTENDKLFSQLVQRSVDRMYSGLHANRAK